MVDIAISGSVAASPRQGPLPAVAAKPAGGLLSFADTIAQQLTKLNRPVRPVSPVAKESRPSAASDAGRAARLSAAASDRSPVPESPAKSRPTVISENHSENRSTEATKQGRESSAPDSVKSTVSTSPADTPDIVHAQIPVPTPLNDNTQEKPAANSDAGSISNAAQTIVSSQLLEQPAPIGNSPGETTALPAKTVALAVVPAAADVNSIPEIAVRELISTAPQPPTPVKSSESEVPVEQAKTATPVSTPSPETAGPNPAPPPAPLAPTLHDTTALPVATPAPVDPSAKVATTQAPAAAAVVSPPPVDRQSPVVKTESSASDLVRDVSSPVANTVAKAASARTSTAAAPVTSVADIIRRTATLTGKQSAQTLRMTIPAEVALPGHPEKNGAIPALASRPASNSTVPLNSPTTPVSSSQKTGSDSSNSSAGGSGDGKDDATGSGEFSAENLLTPGSSPQAVHQTNQGATDSVPAPQPNTIPGVAVSNSRNELPAKASTTDAPSSGAVTSAMRDADDVVASQSRVVNTAQLNNTAAHSEMHIAMQAERLGAVELHARVSGELVGAAITVEKKDAHAAMAAELPSLQQALSEMHLRVENVSLTQGVMHSTADNAGNAGQEHQQERGAGPTARYGLDGGEDHVNPVAGSVSDSSGIFNEQGRLSVLA